MNFESKTEKTSKSLININKKTFFGVIFILLALLVGTIVLTYILPKGSYIEDQGTYLFVESENQSGIAIWKGMLAPILVLFSSDGINIFFLLFFILVISGCFQTMNDTSGIKVIVSKLVNKFRNRERVLIALIILIFMLFGSLFGLFEEVLALLPVIITVVVALGYDPYLAFIICTVATGYGFSCALTNPFTIILASQEIGANIMSGFFFRVLSFGLFYIVLLLFAFYYMKRNKKEIVSETVLETSIDPKEESRISKIYVIFLASIVGLILIVSSLPIRDYIIIFMIVGFLFGGMLAGYLASKNFKTVLKSYGKGVLGALPALFLIMMATSIPYILREGNIRDSITYKLEFFTNFHPLVSLIAVLGIVVALEFFVSSSTAKAKIVVGVLNGIFVYRLGFTKELLVLIYTYGDGFTNVFFPTSPVLLIGLALCGTTYGKWIKRSWLLILVTLVLVISLIYLAYVISY